MTEGINAVLDYWSQDKTSLEEPEKTLIEFNKSQQNTPPRRVFFD